MSRRDQEWWDTFSAALVEHLNEDYPVLDIPPTEKLFGVKAKLAWSTDLGGTPEDPEVRVRAHVREFCLSDPSIQRIETSTTFATSVHIDPQDQISMDLRSISTARFVGEADSGWPILNRTEIICQPKIAEMVNQAASTTIAELGLSTRFPFPEYRRGSFRNYEAFESDLPNSFRIPGTTTGTGLPVLYATIAMDGDHPVVYLPRVDDDYGKEGFRPSREVAELTLKAAIKKNIPPE